MNGLQLAQEGMQRTLQFESDWLPSALKALEEFASLPEWRTFKLEDFRAWYGVQPHSHKVWGAFTNSAVKRGLIRHTGRFARAVSPKTHAHWVPVWEAA